MNIRNFVYQVAWGYKLEVDGGSTLWSEFEEGFGETRNSMPSACSKPEKRREDALDSLLPAPSTSHDEL